ncbi:MAG: hypothetical protein EBR02_08460 [Alphaproteobacteria bacterium]|nr:hypothetical protein [Alphaproteobacteria bacterium]
MAVVKREEIEKSPLYMLAAAVLELYQNRMKFDSDRGEFLISGLKREEFNPVSRAMSALGGDKQTTLNDGAIRITGEREAIEFAQTMGQAGFNFTGQANVPKLGVGI